MEGVHGEMVKRPRSTRQMMFKTVVEVTFLRCRCRKQNRPQVVQGFDILRGPPVTEVLDCHVCKIIRRVFLSLVLVEPAHQPDLVADCDLIDGSPGPVAPRTVLPRMCNACTTASPQSSGTRFGKSRTIPILFSPVDDVTWPIPDVCFQGWRTQSSILLNASVCSQFDECGNKLLRTQEITFGAGAASLHPDGDK